MVQASQHVRLVAEPAYNRIFFCNSHDLHNHNFFRPWPAGTLWTFFVEAEGTLQPTIVSNGKVCNPAP